jgi:hypothetical protein
MSNQANHIERCQKCKTTTPTSKIKDCNECSRRVSLFNQQKHKTSRRSNHSATKGVKLEDMWADFQSGSQYSRQQYQDECAQIDRQCQWIDMMLSEVQSSQPQTHQPPTTRHIQSRSWIPKSKLEKMIAEKEALKSKIQNENDEHRARIMSAMLAKLTKEIEKETRRVEYEINPTVLGWLKKHF